MSIMNEKLSLDKHKKYKHMYGKNELYWGVGIENELYLEFDKKISISQTFLKNNHKRERYSVDYFDSYKKSAIESAFDEHLQHISEPITLPLLVNSHSFMYTDAENNHQTTYTTNPKTN